LSDQGFSVDNLEKDPWGGGEVQLDSSGGWEECVSGRFGNRLREKVLGSLRNSEDIKRRARKKKEKVAARGATQRSYLKKKNAYGWLWRCGQLLKTNGKHRREALGIQIQSMPQAIVFNALERTGKGEPLKKGKGERGPPKEEVSTPTL